MSRTSSRISSAFTETSRSNSAPVMPSLHHPVSSSSTPKSATFYVGANPFGFQSKTSFDATKELQKYRSATFTLPPSIVDDDIWKRSAPDFRPQRYAPKPAKRNSRDAMQPWKYGTIPGQKVPVIRDNQVIMSS